MATNLSPHDSQSTSPARPALPVVRPSAHMRTIAYILRQAARFNEDAENKTVYQSASEDLEAAADRVDETEQKLATLAADNARLRAALEAAKDTLDSLASELEYGNDRSKAWAYEKHSKAFAGYMEAKKALKAGAK